MWLFPGQEPARGQPQTAAASSNRTSRHYTGSSSRHHGYVRKTATASPQSRRDTYRGNFSGRTPQSSNLH